MSIVNLHELVSQPPKRDTLVFEASNAAYKKVGLVSHPGKQKRNETKGILLGADFDGQVGRVSAPRSRILLLVGSRPKFVVKALAPDNC